MKIRINTRSCVNIVLLFLMTLFVYRSTFIISMLSSSMLQAGIMVLALLCALTPRKKMDAYSPVQDICLILSVFYFIFAIRHVTESNRYQLMLYILIVSFVFLTRNKTDYFIDCEKIILVFAITYAFTVILQWKFPKSFNSMIIPLFSDWNKEYIIKIFTDGYYMGLNNLVGDTAGYLVMGILFVVSAYLERMYVKKSRVIILGILLFALLLTGKRAHIAFVFLACAALMILRNRNEQMVKRFLKITGGLVLFLVLAAICLLVFPKLPVIVRFKKTYENLLIGKSIGSGRDQLYRYALELFRENYLFGIGWDIFPKLTVEQMGYASKHDVNNSYLQLLCETGIIGTFIFLMPMFASFFNNIKLLKKWVMKQVYMDPFDIRMLIYCCGYQIFFWLYCLTESPIYDTVYLYMYFITMAFGFALIRKYFKIKKEMKYGVC